MQSTLDSDTPKAILAQAGLRITRQREIILNIIQHLDSHPDADEVYGVAKKKLPRINLSTVYRTLQTLKERGLIDTHRFSEEHHHYEVNTAREHHHLVCRQCGEIVECDLPIMDQIKKHAHTESGFKALSSDITVYGICGSCLKAKVGRK
ncbi:MAG: transcriptional repressor [Spirochaetales bacterium]|nr:transcriptional repressor [Spirochaetales bacterium]